MYRTSSQIGKLGHCASGETTRAKALLVLVVDSGLVVVLLLLLPPRGHAPTPTPTRQAHQTVASCPSCGARRR
jgi:hypothetical protein